MNKYQYYPSSTNVIVRIISVQKNSMSNINDYLYLIIANRYYGNNSSAEELAKIYIDYWTSDIDVAKFIESLKVGDIINCHGNITCSNFNSISGYYNHTIIWDSINLIYSQKQ